MRAHPRPWSFVEVNDTAFMVKDAEDQPVAFVYYDEREIAGTGARKHTRREAQVIAAWVVRMANGAP